MASKPSPSSEGTTRVLRSLSSLRTRRAPGARSTSSSGAPQREGLGAARGAERLRAGLGVGLQRRLHGVDALADPSTAPWGLWQTAGGDPAPQQLPNLALVRYAETLRRKRGPARTAPQRGLPLVVRRRGGTTAGPHTGPGGLAQALVPVDRPERPDIVAILRDGRRPAATPAPLPRPRTDRGRR